MNICILNSVHPASDTRVLRVASTLAEYGHRVTVVSPSSSGVDDDLRVDKGSPRFVDVRKPKGVFRPGSGLLSTWKVLVSRLMVEASLFRQGWRLRADVYHCNEVDSWFVGIALKLLLGKRVVFDAHEYYPSKLIDFLPWRWLRDPVEKLLVRFFMLCSRMTDGAIFVNRSLLEFYGFKCQQTVVRNCIKRGDVDKVQVDRALATRYQTKTLLVHIGRMREIYGASVLLESMSMVEGVPNLLCLVVGGVDQLEVFEKRARDFGVEQQIEIVDHIPFERLLQYLRLADMGLIVVQPWRKSIVYSLARKFLEYIAFGLPVIASDFPEMRHVVMEYDLGLLVDPEDPQDIAAAITTLAKDADLRRRLGCNSQRAFVEEFNWELEQEQLLSLYNRWA